MGLGLGLGLGICVSSLFMKHDSHFQRVLKRGVHSGIATSLITSRNQHTVISVQPSPARRGLEGAICVIVDPCNDTCSISQF